MKLPQWGIVKAFGQYAERTHRAEIIDPRCWKWLDNCCLRPKATVPKSSSVPRYNSFDCSLNRHEITVLLSYIPLNYYFFNVQNFRYMDQPFNFKRVGLFWIPLSHFMNNLLYNVLKDKKGITKFTCSFKKYIWNFER
jgi:hypothetical protein